MDFPLLQRLRTVDKGSRHELMKVVPVHQAMKRSNCKFIDYVDASFLDKSIQQELKSCHKKKQDRLYPDLVRLMEGGAPKVRVVEILDRSNPARFYTPPHITTFGVVAATKFRKGEYILCYWGRLRVAEDYATDSVGAESEWFARQVLQRPSSLPPTPPAGTRSQSTASRSPGTLGRS